MIFLNGNILIFLFLTPILSLINQYSYVHLHKLGTIILTSENYLPLFEYMNNLPIINYTNWNNTISMGGYVLSLILFYPLYVIIKFIIKNYRVYILPKLKKSKLFKIFKIPKWVKFFVGNS